MSIKTARRIGSRLNLATMANIVSDADIQQALSVLNLQGTGNRGQDTGRIKNIEFAIRFRAYLSAQAA